MTFSEGKAPQYSSTLLRSFQIQLRVIGALLMREVLTRYGRHNIGFLWVFVEPMIFTLGVTALWTFAKMHHNSSIPIVAFAVTGYSSVLLWRNMPNRCVGSIEPNLALMYHRNVKVIDVFAARVLLEAVGASTSFIILSVVFISIGWMQYPQDIFKVLTGWCMLAWFGASIAVLMGSLNERTEVVEKLWHPATYLLFPLSGAAFMVDWLPPTAQKIILFLPMVHGVEILREGYFGSLVRSHYSISYMASVCLILNALALAQERYVSKRIIPE
ncbi:ABC transporter permease [Trichlorobacter lovleyi]|uniref:ABC-2 type transporter n=1 Tax=Trichlorobacter lovleyi (strain ATCC BAA-1151 / DSM 17278 / SZ) TaxID=398767 RepID=B3E8X1_TRIL1|nr:ABC transporter permease [Trichlorobacter lovleyi]ACD95239.1 ABC-2 type transporter [Trichlorobacter lovleyi SZ]